MQHIRQFALGYVPSPWLLFLCLEVFISVSITPRQHELLSNFGERFGNIRGNQAERTAIHV